METLYKKSQQNSEVSLAKLDSLKSSPPMEQNRKLTYKAFNPNNHKPRKGALKNNQQDNQGCYNYESDEGFLTQLFQIIQKHRPQVEDGEQHKQISDQTCDYIHKLCSKHREASKFNVYSDYESSKIPPEAKCKCGCGRPEGEALPICTDELEHYFFGSTLLIFYFLRRIIVLLIVLALVYGVYAVVTNSMSAPEGIQCDKPGIGMLSFLCTFKMYVNTMNKLKENDYMTVHSWLGASFCLIWIIGIRLIRSMGRNLNIKIDSLLDSSSDYVIQISNLPYGSYTENELIAYIDALAEKRGEEEGTPVRKLQVKSVQVVYQMDEARKMIKTIIGCARKLASHLVKKQVQKGKIIHEIKQGQLEVYLDCKADLIKSMMKIEQYRNNFISNSELRKQLATDIAFIEFTKADDQAQILSSLKQQNQSVLSSLKSLIFSNQQDNYTFKGNNIQINRAPEPSDINWLNCEKKYSLKRIALVWAIALLMLCISFGFLNLIRFLRTTFSVLQSFSILVSISLQTFNRIIWNTLLLVISLEQNNTKTENIISIMRKGAFAQAINVLVVPLIFNYVLKRNLTGSQGLIGTTIDYHFTFLIMQTFLTWINVPYQFAKLTIAIPWTRYWVIRKYSNVVGQVDTADDIKQVLAYYETPTFNIASAYTGTNTIIFHTVFYMYMQPVLIFSLIFSLCFLYFMHRFLLLRRYKIPELVDFKIFENFCSYLQHVPLIYALGSLTFTQLMSNEQGGYKAIYFPSILCIGIWLINIFNPFGIFNRITNLLLSLFNKRQQHVVRKVDKNVDVQEEEVSQESQGKQRVFQRRQCYYNGCGTTQLLEYEAKLTEVKRSEEYQNLNKYFCQKFNSKQDQTIFRKEEQLRKFSKKPSSAKMLLSMKESFSLVGQKNQALSTKRGKDNKIIPIDIYKFNEEDPKSINKSEKQNKHLKNRNVLSKVTEPIKFKIQQRQKQTQQALNTFSNQAL